MKKSHPAGTIIKRMLAILMTIIMVAGLLPDTLSGVLTAWADNEAGSSITLTVKDADEIHAGDTAAVNFSASVEDGYQGGEIEYTVKAGGDTYKQGKTDWAASGSFTFDTKDENKTKYTIEAVFTAASETESSVKISDTTSVTVYKYYTVSYKEMLCNNAGNKLDDQSKAAAIGNDRSVKYGDKVSEPSDPAAKTGYTFDDWVNADGSTHDFDETISQNTTVYAKYKRNSYTMKFDADGGTPAPGDQTVEYEQKAKEPTKPSKDNYVFDGWQNGNSIFNFNNAIVRDLNLKAKWTKLHNVTFSLGTHGTGTVPTSDPVRTGGRITKPADPQPETEYYRFDKWVKGGSNSAAEYNFDTALTDADDDITLTATWIERVKISFMDPASSSAQMEVKDSEDNIITELYIDKSSNFDTSTVTPSKKGYKFVGWTAAKDGGNFYTDKQAVSTLTTEDKGNVDLYAQWEDTTAPSITFTAREADSKDVAEGDLPLAKESVQYTIKVTDDGTGVNTDSVQYALPDKDADTSDKSKLTYTDAKGTYDKATQTYTFKVTTAIQGFVVVRASDNNKDAYTLSDDKKTYTKTKGTANTGYSEASALVLENTKPGLTVNVENEKLPEKSHKITVNAADSTKPYSGIQKVTYTLSKGETPVIGETAVIDNSNSAPKELKDIEEIKEYRGKEITFDSGSYNGEYTLTVTATDWCGNNTTVTEKILYDNTAPSIGLTLSGENSNRDNGLYYYNDGIHDLTFTVGEDDANASRITNFSVTITNQDDTSKTKTYTEKDFSGSADGNKYNGTISAADLKTLGVGRFSITASSTDRAGNNTSNISTYSGLTPNAENTVTALSYYLDTGSPQLTVSADGGNQDAQTLHWYHNAGDTLTFTLMSDADGKSNSANFKEFKISIRNTDTGKEKKLTQTLTTTDADTGTRRTDGLKEMTGAYADSNNETLTLKLSDIKDQLGEGTINITGTATDLSNNTTSVFTVASDRTLNYADRNATASFLFDYTAPAITVSMGGTDGHGDTENSGDYFYKADNAGITIDLGTDKDKAELQSYTVTVSDSGEGDEKQTLTETLTDGRTVKHTGKEGETIEPTTAKKITFSAEEVAALADGRITVTVTAADYAENGSDLSGKNDAAVTVTNLIHNGTEATFTLDTIDPVLTEINTSVAGQGPYDEDKDYYYKKGDNTTTKFIIVDVNCYTMSIGYEKDGEDQTAITADKYADNVTLDYNGFTDGKYTEIKLYAHDKAGNALVLGDDYTAAQAEDRDAVDNGDGTVSVTHNRIVDTTAPIATITYSSDAKAYLYGDETGDNYKEGTAYINRNLSTQVQITDKYGSTDVALDAEKLTVTENGTAYDKDDQYNSGSYNETKTVSAEGSYIYSVFGTDRAGNPVTVQEESIKSGIGSAEKLSGKQDYKSTENCGTAYSSRYRITIDKTSPTFKFDFPKVSGYETVDGTTAYYGSVHKSLNGTFTVSETNFDPSRFGAGYVDRNIGNSARYNQQSLDFKAGSLEHGWSTSGGTSTLTKTIGTAEGIYMFEIQGCDKAGNPVVKSTEESQKKDYTETVAHGSDAFVTHYKVIDTTAPTGTLDIGRYYHVDMNKRGDGSNTLRADGYDPYREETHANISITSSDQSPIRINYDIVSTIANTRSLEQNYANDNKASSSVSGEQVFNIANLVLMDRAGNRSGFINSGRTSANKIYLDVTPPTNYDVEKPVATITSTTKVTRRSADGRDLYNRGVSLGLKVVDPGARVRSAGLDSIHYTVKADGRTIVDETVDKNSAKAPLYNETSLDYEWSLDLPIHSGGVYETNDIVVTVDAVDNAGNKADTVTYKFGIDTVGPEITATYDNNSAQHDKYFKANRTATVTVLDRNVDDGKISIKTEAGVPKGYSYTSGGGNGRRDIWTKKIPYTADGDYTLNISGTDALGNRAAVRYVGTAAQDFTIDKTKPVISVTFDNNDVRNGKYYRRARNATVSIDEHNFLASEVKIVPSASIQSGRGSQPGVRTGRFGASGDRHAANVGFLDDGNYSMVVDYTDMAGNEAQQATVDEFVVDTTAPTIKFNDIPQINGGDVAPVVTVDDTNFSADLFNMIIAGVRRGDHKLAFGTAFGTYGGTASFRNIEVKRENDDIYTITATITDLAGNESKATLKFSVNRFGSTFDYNNKTTRTLVNTYYANKEKEVQLVENNVNKLKSHTVLLYWNGEIRTLVEGTDYTVEENPVTGGYSYVYRLNSDNFSGEGIYNIVIQSEDEAGNKNTNSSVKIDGGTESVPVEFQIDKTLPTSSFGGFDTDKYQFNASSLDINVKPTDDVKLASVRVTRYDSSGNALGDPVYYSYDEAEIASGKAQDLSKALDSDGRIAYTVDGYNRDQYLEVIATDAASNNSEDHTYTEPEDGRGVIRGTSQRMLVTSSLVAHYTHTPWMIILTIALAGFIIFLIFWKRK